MASDWIPGVGYGVPVGVEIIPGTPFVGVLPLVGTGLGLDPAGNQVGVPDTDPESLLVHRCVGQIDFFNISQETSIDIQVRIRFVVGLYSQATGAIEVFTEDLDDASDANESFAHERRIVLPQGVRTLDVRTDPAWAMYDIKSKRSLASSQWYCAVIEATSNPGPGGEAGILFVQHYLRSWVTWKKG